MHINNENKFHKIQHRLCPTIFCSTLFHCFKNCCHYSLKWFHEKLKCYLHLTLGNFTDCSLPVSSAHDIFQARILEWIDISYSRGSSPSRDWAHISCISFISSLAGRFFNTSALEMKWKSLSHVWLFATLWTIQSREFFRPEYWSE